MTSSEVVTKLESDEGVEKLLEKLDGLFLVNKGRRQFTAFQDLYNIRSGEMEIQKFVSLFEHTYFQFTIHKNIRT